MSLGKWAAGIGCLTIVVFIFVLGGPLAMSIFAVTNLQPPKSDGSVDTGLTGGAGTEQIFVLTHYTPCTPEYRAVSSCDPDMEGDSSTASGATAIYDPASPMGFYAKYKEQRYYYVFAAVQNMHNPLIPTYHFSKSKTGPDKGVYFDDNKKVFVALDCFATTVTASNAMDIMASNEGYKKFVDNLKKAGLYVDSKGNNGLSHGVTRAKGTLAEIIKAGTGT